MNRNESAHSKLKRLELTLKMPCFLAALTQLGNHYMFLRCDSLLAQRFIGNSNGQK